MGVKTPSRHEVSSQIIAAVWAAGATCSRSLAHHVAIQLNDRTLGTLNGVDQISQNV